MLSQEKVETHDLLLREEPISLLHLTLFFFSFSSSSSSQLRRSVRDRFREILDESSSSSSSSSSSKVSHKHSKKQAQPDIIVDDDDDDKETIAAAHTCDDKSQSTSRVSNATKAAQIEAVLFDTTHEHQRCKGNYKMGAKHLCSSLRINSAVLSAIMKHNNSNHNNHNNNSSSSSSNKNNKNNKNTASAAAATETTMIDACPAFVEFWLAECQRLKLTSAGVNM